MPDHAESFHLDLLLSDSGFMLNGLGALPGRSVVPVTDGCRHLAFLRGCKLSRGSKQIVPVRISRLGDIPGMTMLRGCGSQIRPAAADRWDWRLCCGLFNRCITCQSQSVSESLLGNGQHTSRLSSGGTGMSQQTLRLPQLYHT
jgi:hypothetical protein